MPNFWQGPMPERQADMWKVWWSLKGVAVNYQDKILVSATEANCSRQPYPVGPLPNGGLFEGGQP